MRNLLVNHSYLGTGDLFAPLRWLDRLTHPFKATERCQYRGKELTVSLTRRAQRKLLRLDSPLLVEMQIYFSCMVKKRVLFHMSDFPSDSEITTVSPNLSITVRVVQSDSCDPVEFARHYPGKRALETPAAKMMRPRKLAIDYRNDQWKGDFSIA